jgi:hypothetical protein
VNCLRKCCISSAVDGSDNDILWEQNVRSVWKMKGLTLNVETLTLRAKGK